MRFRLLALAISGVVMATSACSDPTAPLPMTTPDRADLSRGLANGGRGNNSHGRVDADSSSYTVTIDAAAGNIPVVGQLKRLSGYLVAE